MLCFRKIPVAKKFRKKKGEGEYRSFPSRYLCLKVPKKFVADSFSLSLLSCIEKIYASEGFVTIISRNIFFSQYGNIS